MALGLGTAEAAEFLGVTRETIRKAKNNQRLQTLSDGSFSRAELLKWNSERRAPRGGAKSRVPTLPTKPQGVGQFGISSTQVGQPARRLVYMEVGPAGIHPLAIHISGDIWDAAWCAAEVLLQCFSREQLIPLIEELVRKMLRSVDECFAEEGIPPPDGLLCWTDWEGFSAVRIMEKLDWDEIIAEQPNAAELRERP